MRLSAQSILLRRKMITPFHDRTVSNGMTFGLGPAGYDVRILESINLEPGDFVLASTMERFDMPRDLVGRITNKSTWARQGLDVTHSEIEPGWRGYLTLELYNKGSEWLMIESGCPIAQIIFEPLDEPTLLPYEGKYQDQPMGAVPAIFEAANDRFNLD